MPVIELRLPEDLDKAIELVCSDKKKFILDAVTEKLRETKTEELQNELIEGYKNSRRENEIFLKEFQNVDLEHWDEY